MKLIEIEAPLEADKRRLDHFLVEYYGGLSATQAPSRSRLSAAVRRGEIRLNGLPAKPGTILSAGDKISLPDIEFFRPQALRPSAKRSLNIIYEDENIIVLNKPAGLSVHPVENKPNERETLAHLLLSHDSSLTEVGEDALRPGIVHRLDADTSGVMLVARNQKSFLTLKKMFAERKVRKNYLALVYGHLPTTEGEINFSLARSPRGDRQKALKSELEAHVGTVRAARTLYHLKQRFAAYDLVQVQPLTGRTHQIRVHLAALGCPIVGDKLYRRRGLKKISIRQFLHAQSIDLELFGRRRVFAAPLSEDLRRFLQTLG